MVKKACIHGALRPDEENYYQFTIISTNLHLWSIQSSEGYPSDGW